MSAVAYLVNQYPKVSHSFIRREILALERLGVSVTRFAVRGEDAVLVDPEDLAEQGRTRFILARGPFRLLGDLLGTAVRRPAAFWRALSLALKVGTGADRPLWVHLIYLAEACALHGQMLAEGLTHVHAHFGTNSTAVAMLTAELGGISYSFTVHGPEEFDKPQAIRLGEKISRAAFVVAITSFCRSQLYRWSPVGDWPKVQVVRCGLDAAFLKAPPVPTPAVPQIVCIGRLCEQKGQLLLVQAMKRLVDEGCPGDLVLAGDGELRPQLEAEIARLGLGARVSITGWVSSDQVKGLLQASRLMVLPSFAEGLPVVVMEAMALGRAVLTTRIAGHAELVEDGVTGWLIDAGSVDALVDALREALTAPTERLDQMGQVARTRVAARHDIDREASVLAACFEAVAAKERG